MKIQYRFPVEGFFRLARSYVLHLDGATISVETSQHSAVRAVMFTYALPADSPAPTITVDSSGMPHISFPRTPFVDHAMDLARNMQDQLCMLGLESIDVDNFGATWIPETPEEEKQIGANNFQSRSGIPEQAFAKWKSTLFLRSLETSNPDSLFRLQLTFYREGSKHFHRWEHATAFMFFFFFIEALFGDSKIKTDPLVESFRRSQELVDAATCAVTTLQPHSAYRTLSVGDGLERIVDRRGYLFHNPSKRGREWGESIHKDMGDDAAYLASVASRVVIKRLWPNGTFPAAVVVHDEQFHRLADFMEKNPPRP